ncbi:Uncharacterised protein [Serratia proteamaculans]|uniref:hypothetical protein n=1 Tax=Serratia proteamaculans TaxID=28151 RepID=UPI002178F887|nr:hypothetical protein [Serratia proteamaculans]CAI0726220.1 Uncharacterised protein [Serratia proteamaculans]CAI1521943.1 Uncharacterised protein [Serratia proteamaculans]
MDQVLSNGFRDAIRKATELSESDDRYDKFAAIAIFSISLGKYISRTAQTHLEKLTGDADQEIAAYAKKVLESVNLLPRE